MSASLLPVKMPKFDEARVRALVPYPALFLNVLGSHAYGLAHEDSDLDVRGSHVLPLEEVVGLRKSDQTFEHKSEEGDVELSSHDVEKFCALMLKRNCGVLEELYSPYRVVDTWEAQRLRVLGLSTFTSNHGHHYLRLARNQWERGVEHGVKPKMLVYLFRAYLSGLILLEAGDIIHNMSVLVGHYDGQPDREGKPLDLSLVRSMMEAKRRGEKDYALTDDELAGLEALHLRMRAMVEWYMETTTLPERVPESVVEEMNRFVIGVRLKGVTRI
jgi:hypothetical protein